MQIYIHIYIYKHTHECIIWGDNRSRKQKKILTVAFFEANSNCKKIRIYYCIGIQKKKNKNKTGGNV